MDGTLEWFEEIEFLGFFFELFNRAETFVNSLLIGSTGIGPPTIAVDLRDSGLSRREGPLSIGGKIWFGDTREGLC